MTEEDHFLIKEFKGSIARLFAQYEKLESEKKQLEERYLKLQSHIELLMEENGKLGLKYENLKLAKSFETGYDDNQEAKQKITKLLREVDKCIALLNR